MFIYFPIDDRLDSFQILDATNDDALTIHIQVFLEIYASFFWISTQKKNFWVMWTFTFNLLDWSVKDFQYCVE